MQVGGDRRGSEDVGDQILPTFDHLLYATIDRWRSGWTLIPRPSVGTRRVRPGGALTFASQGDWLMVQRRATGPRDRRAKGTGRVELDECPPLQKRQLADDVIDRSSRKRHEGEGQIVEVLDHARPRGGFVG